MTNARISRIGREIELNQLSSMALMGVVGIDFELFSYGDQSGGRLDKASIRKHLKNTHSHLEIRSTYIAYQR